MSYPDLPTPQERPVSTASKVGSFSIVRWLREWEWVVFPGLTLLVVAFQAYIMYQQTNIMDKQTSLIDQQTEITAAQHKLAARPNVVTSLDGYIWKIENKGPYPVRDLRLRVLLFKKFVSLGWQDSITGEVPISDVLAGGQTTTVDLNNRFFTYSIKDRTGNDYASVRFAEFHVVALVFKREVDDKRYLLLQPFQVSMLPGEPPKEIKPDITSTAGPVDRACMMDTYAVELTYEFFKRNPFPYPVEPYNYHYLLGMPATTCLQTGPESMRW